MEEEHESKSRSHRRGFATDQPEPGDQTPVRSLAGKRIVICEDEGITQLQLKRILTRAGLIVAAVAGNGKDGVEAVLREKPDLVLMDIKMPVMDGLEAAKRIMAERPVCIVMLTAYVTEEYQVQAADLGACGYVIKPITGQTLIPQIQEAYSRFSNGS